MQIHKNEITTGLLVLVTFGILVVVLVVIGMPGVIRPVNTYRIYYDNAAGIRPGDPVLLAGREIGTVNALHSPVPLNERPDGHTNYEVFIEVKVDRAAQVYRNTTARLEQQGLMGQQVIDFVHGNETSDLATNHTSFVGERIPDLSESVSDQMKRLTGEGSDLALMLKGGRQFIDSLNTGQGSDMALMIKGGRQFIDSLNTGKGSDMAIMIKNTRQFTETLNRSEISAVIKNARQFTDTVKREPWRLIWPSTKKYPEDEKPKDSKNE